jgi:tetratricopeptide (TPR) repeat protein
VKAALCDFLLSCALATHALPAPDALEYRAVLFDHYRGARAEALAAALVLRRVHTADPARWSVLLAAIAAEPPLAAIGAQALDELRSMSLAADDRLRVAVIDARASHAAHDWDRLTHALDEIARAGATPDEALAAEIEFLHIELAIARTDFAHAQTILRTSIADTDARRAYGWFNLGVALRRSGALDDAERAFTELLAMRVYSPDALDLKERAIVALAYLKQQRTETASAESLLKRLSADSRYHDIALASYASLSMDGGDYDLAARIWLSLRDAAHSESARLSALVGYPMSLEHVAAPSAALAEYRNARAALEQRTDDLSVLGAAAASAEWRRALLNGIAHDGTEGSEARLLRDTLGADDWLDWSTREDVRAVVGSYRTLSSSAVGVDEAARTTAALTVVAAEQRARIARDRPALTKDLVARRASLAAALNEAGAHARQSASIDPRPDVAWIVPFATEREAAALARLRSLRDGVTTIASDLEVARDLAMRIDRIEAAIFFDVVHRTSASGSMTLDLLATITADVGRLDATVANLGAALQQADVAATFDFGAIERRSNALAERIAAAQRRCEAAFASIVTATIDRLRATTQRQLQLTQIGIARATDRMDAPP